MDLASGISPFSATCPLSLAGSRLIEHPVNELKKELFAAVVFYSQYYDCQQLYSPPENDFFDELLRILSQTIVNSTDSRNAGRNETAEQNMTLISRQKTAK